MKGEGHKVIGKSLVVLVPLFLLIHEVDSSFLKLLPPILFIRNNLKKTHRPKKLIFLLITLKIYILYQN
jgi:hypothetical protein